MRAAALSKGLFPEPHLGEWMQEGQPSSQGQASMTSRVRWRSSSRMVKARAARPTPPG